MAEIIRYVNFASAAGGDGTTNATSGATRAYHSLSDALVAESADLVTAGDNLVIRCGGSTADTDQVVVADWSGFTTGASNDIKIEAETGNEAGTSWDTGKYRLFPSTGFAQQIACNTNQYVTFENLQMGCGSSSGFTGLMQWNAGTDGTTATKLHILNCHFRFRVASDVQFLNLGYSMRSADVVVSNCIFDAIGGTEATGNVIICPGEFYNNTIRVPVASGGYAYRSEGTSASVTVNVKNNLVQVTSGVGLCFNTSDPYTSSATNISSDATSPQASLRSLTATFVSTTDSALDSGDTTAKDAGTDLSADAAYAFSTDILGTTRSGTWDIGAFEIAGASGVSIPIAMRYYAQQRNR